MGNNLNTTKQKKIIEKLGGNLAELDTNLESDLLEKILELAENGGGNGGAEESGNVKVTSKFTKLTFPATVTLPEAVGNWDEYPFEFVGEGVTENGNLLYRFGFNIYSTINGNLIQVDYTTNDGMNFTNMNGEQTIDFGVKIGFNPDMWHDYLSYFMIIPAQENYNGLFETAVTETKYRATLLIKKLPKFDTSGVSSLDGFYMGCSMVEELEYIEMANVTSASSMYSGCKNIKSIPNINTQNLTSMNSMFDQCVLLETIPELEAGKVSNIYSTFSQCNELTNFGGLKDIGKAFTATRDYYSNYTFGLSGSTKLTHESLMNVINNLYDLNLTYDVANGGILCRQKLVLGTKNIAKLTEEEIAIATNKGWDVS